MTKVLHIIKSPSFDSDGRLQKWIGQLAEKGVKSKVVIVEDGNVASEENENQHLSISRKSLGMRRFFKQRKGYVFKIPEYFLQTVSQVGKYTKEADVVVFHDVQQYLNVFYFLFFYRKRNFKIIWDLHELPHDFLLKNKVIQKALKFILNHADAVIYTNTERKDYIKSHIAGIKEKAFFVLNNYPDKDFIAAPKNAVAIPELDEKPYFLWLGAGIKSRNFDLFLKAYEAFKDNYNLVVIGKIGADLAHEVSVLKEEGKVYNRFVKQKEIINYIDGAFLSVVLYKAANANNFYCEPNRLYQLISRNVPIVVGYNPTMKNLVERLEIGVALQDDGSDATALKKSIEKVVEEHEYYKNNLESNDFTILFGWENQMNQITNFIKE